MVFAAQNRNGRQKLAVLLNGGRLHPGGFGHVGLQPGSVEAFAPVGQHFADAQQHGVAGGKAERLPHKAEAGRWRADERRFAVIAQIAGKQLRRGLCVFADQNGKRQIDRRRVGQKGFHGFAALIDQAGGRIVAERHEDVKRLHGVFDVFAAVAAQIDHKRTHAGLHEGVHGSADLRGGARIEGRQAEIADVAVVVADHRRSLKAERKLQRAFAGAAAHGQPHAAFAALQLFSRFVIIGGVDGDGIHRADHVAGNDPLLLRGRAVNYLVHADAALGGAAAAQTDALHFAVCLALMGAQLFGGEIAGIAVVEAGNVAAGNGGAQNGFVAAAVVVLAQNALQLVQHGIARGLVGQTGQHGVIGFSQRDPGDDGGKHGDGAKQRDDGAKGDSFAHQKFSYRQTEG